jgi:pimeloyl-ACP methyl ester carboxylesterase
MARKAPPKKKNAKGEKCGDIREYSDVLMQQILAAHDMGALPALIWAADHPDEVAGLLYIEAPVKICAFPHS